jgi:uncharacterized protein (TIGR02466 family)
MLEATQPLNGQYVDPFPQLICKYRYDFDFKTLYPKILKTFEDYKGNVSALETGNSRSTIDTEKSARPHQWPELQPFIQWLERVVLEQYAHHKYVYVERRIQESWFNIHKRTGETLEHHHNGIGLVATCYLQLPKDSGFIEFRDPLEYHKTNSPIIPELELWKTVECEANDILIFPGWLKHRTQASKSDEDRIVMTLNIR